MLQRRCAGSTFASRPEFHFQGKPRAVRVWDETLEPGEVVVVTTDSLGAMLSPIRSLSSSLADQVQELQGGLVEAELGAALKMPTSRGLSAIAAEVRQLLVELERQALDTLIALSGKTVRVCSGHGKQHVALDIRDAVPADLAPLLVLDASGRVRHTYALWGTLKGGLEHLPSPPKNYSPLKIHVLDKGGSKYGWRTSEDQLAKEIATMVGSKPAGCSS